MIHEVRPHGETPYLDFFIRRNIPYEGEIWEFKASGLPGSAGGITTGLTKEGGIHPGSIIWVDWPNIIDHPERGRINVLLGASRSDVDTTAFSKLLERTNDLCKSIVLYDSFMEERKVSYQPAEIEAMMGKVHLPRPEYVVLDALDRSLLDVFFQQEGFNEKDDWYPGGFRIPWNRLVELAAANRIPLF